MPRDISPGRMALLAKIGGLTAAARHSGPERTAAARAAYSAHWLTLADPEGVLPEDERVRRAGLLKRAHFARLQLKSADARRRKSRVA